MRSTRSRAAHSPFLGKAMSVTKDLQPRYLACWLYSFLLCSLCAVPVISQENMTETATDSMTTASSPVTIASSDVTVTSLDTNTTNDTTEIGTELVTELLTEWVNVTMLPEVNQTFQSVENATENVTTVTEFPIGETTADPTAENNTLQMTTEKYSNGTTSYESSSLSVNTTNRPAQSSTPMGQTTSTGTVPTTVISNSTIPLRVILHPTSFVILILIYGGLLYLLVIMIFLVIFTKSRTKRSISAYNFTPAANADHTQIGHRNKAYEHGDVADDTDIECSMREMRLEGTTINGDFVQNFEALEEELTPL